MTDVRATNSCGGWWPPITGSLGTRSPLSLAATLRRCTMTASRSVAILHDGLVRVSEIVGSGYRPRCGHRRIPAVRESPLSGGARRHPRLSGPGMEPVRRGQWGRRWEASAIPTTLHESIFASRPRVRPIGSTAPTWMAGTMDSSAARRSGSSNGKNSRMGVGPIETVGAYGSAKGLDQMLATTATHFDGGFEHNGWAWVTNCWEVSLVPLIGHLTALTEWPASRPSALACCRMSNTGRVRRLRGGAHIPITKG